MKLIRYGQAGLEKPAVIINNKYYDTSDFFVDYNEVFFENDGIEKLHKIIDTKKNQLKEIETNVRLGCPVARPSKIICIGLNYKGHAKETNSEVPKEPIIFFKSTTAIIGPNDNVIIPKNAKKLDWEVELAIVIGKKTSYINEADAMNYIAGYCVHNDYSEREFQIERGGQWAKGKGCDTFAPFGPFMATTEEIINPNNLNLWLKVNGITMQNSSTQDFIFNVQFVVSYLSQFMTLLPGDIISTGTPQGVGLGIKPNPIYLKENDIVELGIDGLGSSKQKIVAYKVS